MAGEGGFDLPYFSQVADFGQDDSQTQANKHLRLFRTCPLTIKSRQVVPIAQDDLVSDTKEEDRLAPETLKKKLFPLIMMMAAGVAGLSHLAKSQNSKPVLLITGSTTVKPVVDQGVSLFKKLHPQMDVVVGVGGSSQGIQLVGTRAVSIGMVSRPLDAQEIEQFPDLFTYTIGLDGVAMVTNEANPVRKLSTQQIEDIYIGRITNWKELGGDNRNITLITLNHNHGTSEVFANYFGLEAKESGAGINLKATFRRKGEAEYSSATAKVIEDHRQVLAQIITTPNAIGYVSIGQAMQVIQSGAHVRLLRLDDVEPTVTNVRSGVYRFSRPLMLVTKGEAQGPARDLINLFSEPEGQAIVTRLDYISVGVKH